MHEPSQRTDRRSPADVARPGQIGKRPDESSSIVSAAQSRGRVAGSSPLSYLRSLTRSAKGWEQWRSGRYELPSREPGYAAVPAPARRTPKSAEPKPTASPRWRGLLLRGALVLGLVAVVLVWSSRSGDRLSATVIVPASLQQHFTGGGSTPDTPSDKAARPIYPMSVVPGGAYSVEELKAYVKSDPLARQSFEAQAKRMGDPDLLSHLVVKRVSKPTKMYSQLRKGDKLCWTSQPVTVEEGESGFYHDESDKLVARSRCGNVMVVVVPAGGMRVPAPPGGAIGWTTPTAPQPILGVAGESGGQPQQVQQQQQQQAAPVPVPPRRLEVPTFTLPPLPPIMPPLPTATPPIIIPPYIPPPQQQQLPPININGGGGIPWWGLVGGGLLGGLAGRSSVHVNQNQRQKQKQQQDIEVIPEPGTMLLMALGLGAAGALARRRRKS